MQHNPKNSPETNKLYHLDRKSGNEVIIQNVHQKKVYGSDFGQGTDDPDNVRRQRQDYFDLWQQAHRGG